MNSAPKTRNQLFWKKASAKDFTSFLAHFHQSIHISQTNTFPFFGMALRFGALFSALRIQLKQSISPNHPNRHQPSHTNSKFNESVSAKDLRKLHLDDLSCIWCPTLGQIKISCHFPSQRRPSDRSRGFLGSPPQFLKNENYMCHFSLVNLSKGSEWLHVNGLGDLLNAREQTWDIDEPFQTPF